MTKKCDSNSIALKEFIEFIKIHFAGQTIQTQVKAQLVNLMRNIKKKFGEKVLQEFP